MGMSKVRPVDLDEFPNMSQTGEMNGVHALRRLHLVIVVRVAPGHENMLANLLTFSKVLILTDPEWVEAGLAPAYPTLQRLEQMLQLHDTNAGHLLLDYYNYDLQDLQLID